MQLTLAPSNWQATYTHNSSSELHIAVPKAALIVGATLNVYTIILDDSGNQIGIALSKSLPISAPTAPADSLYFVLSRLAGDTFGNHLQIALADTSQVSTLPANAVVHVRGVRP